MSNFADVIRQRNEEIDKRGRNPLDVIVKIHMRIFLFSLVNVWVSQFLDLSFCTGPPDLMENDTDLKLGTHPLLDLIQKWFFFFCFFEKVTLRAASLEKLPCHVDFPHISSIS